MKQLTITISDELARGIISELSNTGYTMRSMYGNIEDFPFFTPDVIAKHDRITIEALCAFMKAGLGRV